MSFNHSYTSELEALILNELLPIYESAQLAKGVRDPLASINPKLLKQIASRKRLAALLRPTEK